MDKAFGKLITYEKNGQEIKVVYEHGNVLLTVVTEDIVRVLAPRKTTEYVSKAIEKNPIVSTGFEVAGNDGELVLTTAKLRLHMTDDFGMEFCTADGRKLWSDYKGKRTKIARASWQTIEMLEAEGHDASALKEKEEPVQLLGCLDEGDDFYGLGDKSGFLNKKYYEYENWNSDLPQAHNEDFKALYKSIPILFCLKKQMAYGIFFDNTFKSRIDLGKENPEYVGYYAADGNLDFYFMAGADLKAVIGLYTYLTGRTPLPQLWTLGYQQSRWGYENQDDINYVVDTYRKEQIPLDVIHFDIDYMEHFKVFTWNEETYGPKGELFASLKERGVKPVTIIDPGTKKEDGYFMHDEGVARDYFVKDTDGNVYVNAVWPGDSNFPDFGREEVRNWWAKHHSTLVDMGVGGIWNDMNEPASFHGELPQDVVFYDEDRKTTHAEMHNVYGHLMSKATFEGLKALTGKRPFVITRACYAGTQKYSTVWTGDNQSLWSHLQMMIPQLCNLGMSGFAFAGTDIGGFGADCTPELLCRWVEAACFSPLFRNHSAKGTRSQEPWRFGKDVVDINRKYIELRYQFLPYLYDLFYQGLETGLPVMRPLVLEYPQDPEVRNLNSEYMVGASLLVAPILEQGATKRMIYLPEGKWYDFWTGECREGNQYILRDAPIDVCPIYVKEGSIIPMYEKVQYVGEKPYNALTLLTTPGSGEYVHFRDNGEDFAYEAGQYNLYRFRTDENGQLTVTLLQEGYPKYETISCKELGR